VPEKLAEPAPARGVSLGRLDIDQVRDILPELIDALTDAVLVVDRQHRIVAANRRYVETFARLGDLEVGEVCRDGTACPEGLEPGVNGHCVACDVFSFGQSRRLIRTLPDASGAMRRWEVTLNPVVGADGGVGHVVEVWRDITARTQLESQLSHSERLASLGMLAAGVAHEINNPLASIVAGVESLQRWLDRAKGMPPDTLAEVREVLELLERETNRSRETTDKLLLLAQPYQSAPGWVDMNRAARDTLSLLSYQMRKQGIQWIEDLDAELPQVWAREGGIRGVCMNLAMNAVQAMPEGGTLIIRTRRHGEIAILEVRDTGVGIHPSHLERIWDPFFTTKPVGKGTGLGLSITQRVVARLGGKIRVESTPGHGACFIVEIPIAGSGGENV